MGITNTSLVYEPSSNSANTLDTAAVKEEYTQLTAEWEKESENESIVGSNPKQKALGYYRIW